MADTIKNPDVNDYYLKNLIKGKSKTLVLIKPRTNLKASLYSKVKERNTEPSVTYINNYIFDKNNKNLRCSSYRDKDIILRQFDILK